MAKLNSRLHAELGNWQKRLPRAWRPHFADVELDFDAVDSKAKLEPKEKIWPQETNKGRPAGAHVFKAFRDVAPENVRLVVFGNDPYTRLEQATGRSFEQGNLTNWKKDIQIPGRISPSFKTVLAAAVATTKAGSSYPLVDRRVVYDHLDKKKHYGRSPVWISHLALELALMHGAVRLPTPKQIFAHWSKQGVLWINRTLTFTKWDDFNQPGHRQSHQMLWAPFTNCVLDVLISQASSNNRIVCALWGSAAKEMGAKIKKKAKAKKKTSAIRYVETGHPQWVEGHFGGKAPLSQIENTINPLAEINKVIRGKPIEWV